ncbi:MAG: glycosyltransferase family 4 protein [Chitinophagaceae bacterium]
MPKILSIVPYTVFPAKVGGQKGIAFFNEHLARETELVCITVKNNDPAFAKGYNILNILSNGFYRYLNLLYFFRIRKLLRQYGSTHLMLEHPYYGWLGVLLKWFTGVKLIIHSHNIEATRWKSLQKWWWRILWWYERFTHRQADYNFFIQEQDRQYAMQRFGLADSKCITITYGIEWDRLPLQQDRLSAKQQLRHQYGIAENEAILLFNGAFDYSPNLDALKKIITIVNPALQQKLDFHYKIIICGRKIPLELNDKSYDNIIFAGFVDDISTYFKGADVFINPVTEGGGIKTKLVEALGYNMNAVSTLNGAIGIESSWCNGKLLLCADNDWSSFATLITQAAHIKNDIPPIYFERFYWGHLARKAVAFIQTAG